jgi:hypothetical protein
MAPGVNAALVFVLPGGEPRSTFQVQASKPLTTSCGFAASKDGRSKKTECRVAYSLSSDLKPQATASYEEQEHEIINSSIGGY